MLNELITKITGSQPIPKLVTLSNEDINRFCLVQYDEKLWVGQILRFVDDNKVEISCMKPAGVNKFVWPKTRDVEKYETNCVKNLITEPEKAKRFFFLTQMTGN